MQPAHHDIDHQRIEALAYELWQTRGSPEGSPHIDWQRAEELLLNDPGIGVRPGIGQAEETFDGEGFEHPQTGGEQGEAPVPPIRVF